MRENRTCSLSGGRRPARTCAEAPPPTRLKVSGRWVYLYRDLSELVPERQKVYPLSLLCRKGLLSFHGFTGSRKLKTRDSPPAEEPDLTDPSRRGKGGRLRANWKCQVFCVNGILLGLPQALWEARFPEQRKVVE